MANSKLTNEMMKSRRREAILATALHLFSAKGYAATKISDIVKETGMSQGLLYHYFPSKDEIFNELIETAFKRLNDACSALKARAIPPEEKLRTGLRELFRNLETSRTSSAYHFLIAQATISDVIPDEARNIINSKSITAYTIIASIIKEGQRKGSVKPLDPDEMAAAFWTVVKGVALHRAVHGTSFPLPDSDMYCSMFLT